MMHTFSVLIPAALARGRLTISPGSSFSLLSVDGAETGSFPVPLPEIRHSDSPQDYGGPYFIRFAPFS